MGDDLDLLLKIRADVKDAVTKLDKLTQSNDQAAKGIGRHKKAADGLGPVYKRLGASISAYVSVAALMKGLRIADEQARIQARLERTTRAQGDYNRVARETYEIALRTAAPLKETVDLFIQVANAAEDLGKSRNDVLTFVEAIQGLAALDGVDKGALGNALRQLSQSMAGGVVRAEEFNSLVENTPGVVRAIARGLGITTGQLRQMVIDGRLLADDVMVSINSQAKEVAKELESSPSNLQRAGQRLETVFSKALASLDQATGLTQTLAEAIEAMASGLDKLANRDKNVFTKADYLREAQVQRWVVNQNIVNEVARGADSEDPLIRKWEDERDQLDAYIARLQEAIDKEEELSKPIEKIEPGDDPSGGGGQAGKTNAVEARVEALELEAATYGKSAEAALLYRLELDGLTESQRQRAEAAIASIEAQRQQAEADQAATQRQAELKSQLDQVIAQTDPIARYRDELKQLEELMAAFPEHADLIAEAMLDVHEAMDRVGEDATDTADKMDQFAVQAARNIQSELGDTLYSIAKGNFDNILSSWADMLAKMASQALAAQLGKALFGDSFAAGGGDVGGFFGSFLEGIGLFHRGGIIGGAPTASRSDHPALYANAPRYHGGGVLTPQNYGLKPGEMRIIGKVGEEVLTEDSPRHVKNLGSGQAGNGVRILNVIDPSLVQDYMSSAQGEQTILNVLSRRRGDVQSIVQ